MMKCIASLFDYGQRHRAEIDVARELALKLGAVAHKVLDVTLLNELAVSSLTRDNIPVPDYQPDAEGIPNTFVPGRNILFLTLTAIYAYQVKPKPSSPACARPTSLATRTAAMSLSKRCTTPSAWGWRKTFALRRR